MKRSHAPPQLRAAPRPDSDTEVRRAPVRPDAAESLVSTFAQDTGEALSEVRTHDDPAADQAARQRHAAAFTTKDGIYFAAGRYAPATPRGRGLLAHELTHVVQQRRSGGGEHPAADGAEAEVEARGVVEALARGRRLPVIRAHAAAEQHQDEDEDSPDLPATDTAVARTAEQDVDDASMTDLAAPVQVTVRIAAAEPDQLIVPGLATRAQIAARLFGPGQGQRDFDLVPSVHVGLVEGVFEQAVRVRGRHPLVPEIARQLQSSLEAALPVDVTWTVTTLSQRWISDADTWNLAERCLRWSQRSDLLDPGGTPYFDRYLDALDRQRLTAPGLLSDTTRTALEWLVLETGPKSEQIRKAIQLRSTRRSAGYTVTDTRPRFAVGDVIGRFYWPAGSGLQLWVAGTIADEPTSERAETATRNAAFRGMRVVVPGGDGRFYGYGLAYPQLDLLVEPPEVSVGGHFYWYHPQTVLVRAEEFQADVAPGDAASIAHRTQILADALAAPTALRRARVLGLDFDVLTQATLDQRVSLIEVAVDGGGEPAASLVARVLATTTAADFPVLERRISSGPLLNRLLSLPPSGLALLGRLFTMRALASVPMGASALQGLEVLQLGTDSTGAMHAAFGLPVEVDSEVVSRDRWQPTQSPRVGSEPGLAGEAAHRIRRNAIVFQVLVSDSATNPLREARRSRPFLPTELVRINVLGPRPEVLVVTALEAAGLLGSGALPIALRRIGQYQTALMLVQAGSGLLRTFGAALGSGLAQGGLRGALAAGRTVALTQAGRTALFQATLVGSMVAVDAYREDLQRTEAGRVFLATYNVAIALLVARDVYRLLSSGVLREVGRLGLLAAAAAGQAGARALGRLTQDIEAIELAWSRLGRAGELVEVALADGTRSLQPRDPLRLDVLFMQARAEVAGARLTAGLAAAGRPTDVASRVSAQLQQIAATDQQAARHITAVLRSAATLAPTSVDSFLIAVENVLRARPAQAAELTAFLRAAARATDPVAYLGDVQWLLSLPGISNEAVSVLARKAPTAFAVDLAWLRTTGLTAQDISRLGADPITKWNEIRRAAQGALDLTVPLATRRTAVIRALTKLRGIATELAAEEMQAAGEVVPGYRISGSQVPMGSSIIDFRVTPLNRTGLTRGLEIKGHNNSRWRELMNVWDRRAATDLDASEQGFLRNLQGIKAQLADATAASRGRAPFLGVTSDLNAPTKARLERWLASEAPGTQLVSIEEARIQAIYRRLQAAFSLNIPSI